MGVATAKASASRPAPNTASSDYAVAAEVPSTLGTWLGGSGPWATRSVSEAAPPTTATAETAGAPSASTASSASST
jgi:hypothetical protein